MKGMLQYLHYSLLHEKTNAASKKKNKIKRAAVNQIWNPGVHSRTHENHFCGDDSHCLFTELPKLPAPAWRASVTSLLLKET